MYQGSTVKLSGENTRIEGNVTSRDSGDYGLETISSSSKIQIVTPQTKDTISTNNGGGGNWGGGGTIEQVSKAESSLSDACRAADAAKTVADAAKTAADAAKTAADTANRAVVAANRAAVAANDALHEANDVHERLLASAAEAGQ